MKLETTAGNLTTAMKVFAGVIQRRNTIPVLGTVLVGDGKVIGTDLDMQAEVAMPTIGKMKGEAALDYHALARLARHVTPDEALKVEESRETKHAAEVTFNGAAYRISSLPAEDFPRMQGMGDGAQRTETGNAGLVDALRAVRFAVSTEETRYYLNGVAFVTRPLDGKQFVVATDGHRLAMKALPFPIDGAEGKIIPRAAVQFLVERKVEPKAVTFDDTKARFDYDGLTFTTKLIDGTYPDIWRVVPRDCEPVWTVNRRAALPVFRRMEALLLMPFSDGRRRETEAVKISGSAGGAELVFSGKWGDERHEVRETVIVEDRPAKAFEVGYNVRYLVAAISHLAGSEKVTFAGQADAIAGSPALITGDNDSLRIVLMPMRV